MAILHLHVLPLSAARPFVILLWELVRLSSKHPYTFSPKVSIEELSLENRTRLAP